MGVIRERAFARRKKSGLKLERSKREEEKRAEIERRKALVGQRQRVQEDTTPILPGSEDESLVKRSILAPSRTLGATLDALGGAEPSQFPSRLEQIGAGIGQSVADPSKGGTAGQIVADIPRAGAALSAGLITFPAEAARALDEEIIKKGGPRASNVARFAKRIMGIDGATETILATIKDPEAAARTPFSNLLAVATPFLLAAGGRHVVTKLRTPSPFKSSEAVQSLKRTREFIEAHKEALQTEIDSIQPRPERPLEIPNLDAILGDAVEVGGVTDRVIAEMGRKLAEAQGERSLSQLEAGVRGELLIEELGRPPKRPLSPELRREADNVIIGKPSKKLNISEQTARQIADFSQSKALAAKEPPVRWNGKEFVEVAATDPIRARLGPSPLSFQELAAATARAFGLSRIKLQRNANRDFQGYDYLNTTTKAMENISKRSGNPEPARIAWDLVSTDLRARRLEAGMNARFMEILAKTPRGMKRAEVSKQMRQIFDERVQDANDPRGAIEALQDVDPQLKQVALELHDYYSDIRTKIVERMRDRGVPVPDNWGINAYLPRVLPGQFLLYLEQGGQRRVIGSATTELNALAKVRRYAKENPDAKGSEISIEKKENFTPDDMQAVSFGQYGRLIKQLAESSDIDPTLVQDAFRGIITPRKTRSPQPGALKHRQGAAGFDPDLINSQLPYARAISRWLEHGDLVKRSEGPLQKLEQTHPNAARELRQNIDRLLGRRSRGSMFLDSALSNMPGVRMIHKPGTLERWTGRLTNTTARALLGLSARFQTLNSWQIMETGSPTSSVGKLLDAFKKFESKEGQKLLSDNNVFKDANRYLVPQGSSLVARLMGPRAARLRDRVTRTLARIPPLGSETRNQGVTYIRWYDEFLARGQRDMAPAEIPISALTTIERGAAFETRFNVGASKKVRVTARHSEAKPPSAKDPVWSVTRDGKIVEQGLTRRDAVSAARSLDLPNQIKFEADRLATMKQIQTQFLQSIVDQPGFIRGPVSRNVFLFSRFMVKRLELALDLVRSKNYPGAFKFLAANAAIGGLSRVLGTVMLLRALPHAKKLIPPDLPVRAQQELKDLDIGKVLVEMASAVPPNLPANVVPLPAFISPEVHEEIAQELDTRIADAIARGLPTFMGWDLSRSAQLLDLPFGRTVTEMLANRFLGPTGQIAMSLGKAARDTRGVEPRASRRVFDAAARRIPAIRFVRGLQRIAEQDYDFRDPTGRLQYKGDLHDVLSDMLAFSTLTAAKQNVVLENYLDIFAERDLTITRAAQFAILSDKARVAGNEKEREKWEAKMDALIGEWNDGPWTEQAIDGADVLKRALARMEGAEKTPVERLTRRTTEQAIINEAIRKLEE